MSRRSRRLPPVRGRALSELRRSNAAGLHIKRRKDRRNTKRRAIEEAQR